MLSFWALGTIALILLSSDSLVRSPGFKLHCRELKQNTPPQGHGKARETSKENREEKKKNTIIFKLQRGEQKIDFKQ